MFLTSSLRNITSDNKKENEKNVFKFYCMLMSRKSSCQSCIFFTPSFIRIVKIGFFQSGQQLCSFLEKYFDCKPEIYIFSTSAKIALSCDIKSLFRKSVDKSFHFSPCSSSLFRFFYNAKSFDYKKN